MRTVTSALFVAWASGCGDGTGQLPSGGQGGRDDTGGGDGSSGCDFDSWTTVGQVLVDPEECLAWSPRAGPLTWHEAVSQAEATDGGCSTTCDQAPDDDYCANLGSLDGYDGWSVPSLDALSALSIREPPFDDTSGDLWTRSSDSGMDALAWTVDLSQPGREISLDKGSDAHVRCVAHPGR